ncbi:helix-turn-helix domain-containing protein [Nocardia thailandica]|uniref:Helix-turn-helix domain-containing protein n=1 Tax=Nocardia thailandica TaxID=257275 RepID=A0ABW6PX88_9NOCA
MGVDARQAPLGEWSLEATKGVRPGAARTPTVRFNRRTRPKIPRIGCDPRRRPRPPRPGGRPRPGRRDRAGAGECSAGEIAARFPISGPSISRHLGVLKAAGLVRERRVANRVYYSLVEERLALSVGRFLSAICPEQVVIRQRRLRSTKTGAPDETAADDQRRRTTTPRELPGRP